MECIFASRGRTWTEERVRWRTRQVLEAPARLRYDVQGWLNPCFTGRGYFVDLGCGPGMLLAAAAAEGHAGIGIDVSLTWLLAAQRLVATYGGKPLLAAALAEALPLPDQSVTAVISLDVVEHVADPAPYLAEIDRVTGIGGFIALSTPNRYSLAAEPHVYLWGVGWLPRQWQKRYVEWRRGERYEYARLLSTFEMRRLLRRMTEFQAEILIPQVPTEEIRAFSPRRAALARIYNRLVAARVLRWAFLCIGPFFRVLGRKPVITAAATDAGR
jgi:SAM-dependent methyltransferase